ncbi:hypothetical protein [Propioniciclava soli]|uniref:hypothetical protein n=1 Tax=Propioniciclava soli TaxID=2775081 RepID=UPI001E29F229|nr:hypothetical protein [Propioniciclava soli]
MEHETEQRRAEINRLKGIVAIAAVSLLAFSAVFGAGLVGGASGSSAPERTPVVTATPSP